MEIQQIGEIKEHQEELAEISEVMLEEILEEHEDSVEPEAVGVSVEEDREVLIVGDLMIEMMASTTTIISIHSQLMKKIVMKRYLKPKNKSSGSQPRFLNTPTLSKDWLP